MIYLTNAISLNMLDQKIKEVDLRAKAIAPVLVKNILEKELWRNAIGHPDTATLVGKQLGYDLIENRTDVRLDYGDAVIVAQYSGPRLPPGTKELPEGAKIVYWFVSVENPSWNDDYYEE